MTELPPGWAMSSIGELTETSLGKMLDAKQATGQHPTPYLRNVNVRWGTFDLSDVATMDIRPVELERVLARAGDVIACEGGEPGRTAVWRRAEPIALQKALHRVRTGPFVCPDFLALLLRHQAESGELSRLFTGTTIKHLPQEKLRMVRVPVPPIHEQKGIVEAIEEAFSKLDAGEAALRTARQRLKRMRDAVLTAAVTGRLVPQDPTNPPSADRLATHRDPACAGSVDRVLRTLGDVADWSSGGTPKAGTARFYGGPIPWAVIGDLTEGPVWHTQSSLTAEGLERSSAKVVPEGTVLLAMYGASIGRIGVTSREMATNQAIACARPRTDVVTSSYLFWYLRSQRRAFVAQGKGAAQPNISQTIIKTWPVALPPVEEQNRIVADVERQFSFIEACERAVDRGLARAAALRRSVLKAAFEGRLVPQDPSDEPASALLDRIRAERAAGGSPKLRRTRPVRSGS